MTAGRAKDSGRASRPQRNVLVVDVGGTSVKVSATGKRTPRKIASGPTMTATNMVKAVKQLAAGWRYDVVALGYPGPVRGGRPTAEPKNPGHRMGRVRFCEGLCLSGEGDQ